MKKRIPISRFFWLLIILFLLNSGPPEPWRAILRQYIQAWPPSMGPFLIKAHAEASQPQNFTPDMSLRTISNGDIFETDSDFHNGFGEGGVPLPYPPMVVYCVVGEFFSADQTEFYFIALHSDGQHADWVIHKPTGYWKNIKFLMEKIGCDIARY